MKTKMLLSFFLFLPSVTEIFAQKCCGAVVHDGGDCPCGDNYILGWTYDGVCDCKCIPSNPHLICHACPEELQKCSRTCCFLDVVCEGDVCKPVDALDFATVAKIAVLFALVVTTVAVFVGLLRAFLLPRWCQGGRIRSATNNSDARSLNSVQRFVVDRLRSRPPPYEHEPEKPPAYEECMAVNSDVPPAYSVAVINLPTNFQPPRFSLQAVHLENVEMEQLSVEALAVASPVPDMEDFAVLPVNVGKGDDNAAYENNESR